VSFVDRLLRVGGLQSGGAYFLMAFSMLLLKEGFSAAANGVRVSATQTVISSLHLEVADFVPAIAPGNGRNTSEKRRQGRAQPKEGLPDAELRASHSRSLRKNAFI
jgi:hypothetical protein